MAVPNRRTDNLAHQGMLVKLVINLIQLGVDGVWMFTLFVVVMFVQLGLEMVFEQSDRFLYKFH